MAVTLKDVARLAGTDITSVSNTLRQSPRAAELRPETRERILEAARRLGYRRNAFAASMRTGENKTVAVISSYENLAININAHKVLSGILQEASELKYGIKIYPDRELPKRIDEILGEQIRHVICMSVEQPERLELALLCRMNQLRLAYVSEAAQDEFPAVNIDNYNIAGKVAHCLAEHGHRRIALLCPPHRYHYIVQRHNGFLAGLRECGVEPDFKLIQCVADDIMEKAAHDMFALPPAQRPTAVFAIGDGLALTLLHAAIRNGLRVPEDVSIFGFGNSEGSASAFVPLCTTEEKSMEVGKTALRLVLGMETGIAPDAEGNCLIPAELILRDSICAIHPETKSTSQRRQI